MSEELKACPLCQGKITLDDVSNFLGHTRWAGACENEDCASNASYATQAEAITAWNTRATDAENQRLRAEVEALREALSIATFWAETDRQSAKASNAGRYVDREKILSVALQRARAALTRKAPQ